MVLAPQLQQSLALLQAPTLELKALVEQELQQNPVLEEDLTREIDLNEKPDRDETAAAAADLAEPPADMNFDPAVEKPSDPADDFQAEFDKLVQLDQEWRDHFAQTNLPSRNSAEEEEKRQFMFDSLVASTSLQQMLMEQVHESSLPEIDWPVAEIVIGNIDDYGYVKGTVDEIAMAANLPVEKIVEVLKAIQKF
ncbi:MAG TPA: RNA polymerase sigma-54 factor, partial [Verrucomicrobiae bacterium]|nr:RNA polymerase sigma-54 factor [Verrucomicrobiae bacterium]